MEPANWRVPASFWSPAVVDSRATRCWAPSEVPMSSAVFACDRSWLAEGWIGADRPDV